MNNIWFIADTHFGHKNIIKYCNRPFSCVEEMDEIMIYNWNSVVKRDDIVFHLGDFIWDGEKDVRKYFSKLSGQIKIIPGSHDKFIRSWFSYNTYIEYYSKSGYFIRLLSPIHEIQKKKEYFIVMCHYCMRVWNKSHYNSYHLYGHSHGMLESVGKSMDVGVDCNNFTPVSLEDVLKIMETKPNNFNYLGDK
jgi:calcineurin-like phosphoesterase family protein